jgi:hypothetical protein
MWSGVGAGVWRSGERTRHLLRAWVALVGLVLALVGALLGTPAVGRAAELPPGVCQAQQAALAANQQEIAAHNARPHLFQLPRQAAQLSAYNANAARLNAAKQVAITALETCLRQLQARAQALSELFSQEVGAPEPRTLSPSRRAAIEEATRQIPDDWAPPSLLLQKKWEIPFESPVRPLYDALRRGNPGNLGDVKLQGQWRPKVGDPDPARPGRRIGQRPTGTSRVDADHIVTLVRILYLKDFVKLRPDDMHAVVNSSVNLQWLSESVNRAKNSRSMGAVSGIEPSWRIGQIALEEQAKAKLEDVIRRLLDSYEGG